MKTILMTLIVTAGLASFTTWASPVAYTIQFKILVDGKLVSSPKMKVRPNEPASVGTISEFPSWKMNLKVIASPVKEDPNSVLLKMDFKYAAGSLHLASQPSLIMPLNEEVTIAPRDRLQIQARAMSDDGR